ncbi:MAG: hypothetical protein INQ03_19990 [Candidatus Heimdallarchaeota archaeon]|nr:hypothetical protein [Candidatus Heimdallarchaeota archaeon]
MADIDNLGLLNSIRLVKDRLPFMTKFISDKHLYLLGPRITEVHLPAYFHRKICEEFYQSIIEKMERLYFLFGDIDADLLTITHMATHDKIESRYEIPRDEQQIEYNPILHIIQKEFIDIPKFIVIGHTHALTDRNRPFLIHHPLLEKDIQPSYYPTFGYMVTEQINGVLRNDFYTYETMYNDFGNHPREIPLMIT